MDRGRGVGNSDALASPSKEIAFCLILILVCAALPVIGGAAWLFKMKTIT